ncbi:hypothetical protein BN1079_01931 [Pseudomonas saudiphocaensis]|uniref:Uncharacterized protein n=1 Tax=Pseudomonas saudiphocaensis TaxID=1499686 RepID=A0A078LQ08_9PSED|nr:hypothetical protein BN1079_01931 [Pseudomonas saudiphocaensis]
MPVKGPRWGVGFVRGRDQLLQRHAARLLFVGTGHAREGACAGVWVLFAGMARSHRGVQLASFSWERAVPVKGPALFAGMARSYRGVQLASFSWELAMPVKGSALGCGFCSRAWPAPTGR